MNVFEGMYGTSRSSYLALENARMIVRHSAKIDETKIGSRGRQVENIFIENKAGERFLFPTSGLAPARAMAQHVNHGGSFADQVGVYIQKMAEDFANLGSTSRHIRKNTSSLHENALGLRDKCRSKMMEMRKVFERMFRHSGYVAECERIIDEASTLKETSAKKAVSAKKINEMKKLLNVESVSPLSDTIIESVCRCMAEDYLETSQRGSVGMPPSGKNINPSDGNKNEPVKKIVPSKPVAAVVKEAPKDTTVEPNEDEAIRPNRDRNTPKDAIGVLGRLVSKVVWDDFVAGNMAMNNSNLEIDANSHPKFNDKVSEIIWKLAKIANNVSDDHLSVILNHVLDCLENPSDRNVQEYMSKNPRYLRICGAIAEQAIKNAGIFSTGLATKNAVVREFASWINKFSIQNVLMEHDPLVGMHSSPDYKDYDDELDTAVKDFNANDFYSSDIVKDMLSGRDESDDEDDKKLDESEIMSALESYIRKDIETTTGEYVEDVSSAVNTVYEKALAKFEENGFTVNDDDSQKEETDECMDEASELRREDILFPPKNQGKDLKREVVSPMVTDPSTGKMTSPDNGYLERLRQLSGMR